MPSLLLTAISLVSLHASPQECSEASLLRTAGAWKESAKGSYSVTGANLLREKMVLAAITSMVKAKYTPVALQALYLSAYSSPSAIRPVNGYAYSIIPLNYECDGNAIKLQHETSTYFEIRANEMPAAIYDTARGDRLLGEGFNVISDVPVEQDGHYYFKEKDVTLTYGIPGKVAAWLVTYDGKLPYAYVTKKEFLEKRRRTLEALRLESASVAKDALARNEMEKGQKETEYKHEPAKLEKYMRMDYVQIKARYEKLLADTDKPYKPAFAKIDAQLRLSAEELSQPAIVKTDSHDYLSYLFTTAGDPGAKILIKPNPAYFNKQISPSSPQFFYIYLTGASKEPIAAKFRSDVMTSVDFAALKGMLGK